MFLLSPNSGRLSPLLHTGVPFEFVNYMRFQVLTAASMKFRIFSWDEMPCKIIVDNYFTRQYIPEDNSELVNYIYKSKAVPLHAMEALG
jgi:hypothetical protein